MIRTFILALGFLGFAAAAEAAPLLKAEVMVTGAVVTAGDMFEDAGKFATEPLFRAPLPGTSGIVSIDAVRQAASAIGLGEFDADGVARVRVARDATVVDEPMLKDLIVGDLSRRGIVSDGITAETTFDQSQPTFNAEAGNTPATLQNLRYMPGSGVFTARFLIAGLDAPVDLSGHIDLMVEAPHLVNTMKAGAVLSAADVEMKPVPLKFAETAGFARLDDVVGKALVRQSRAGMMLRVSDVSEPQLVSRNDPVTVYFRSGALTLTVKGQALSNAAQGQQVQVLNLMSKKILTGIAVGQGAVEMTAGPTSVAGL